MNTRCYCQTFCNDELIVNGFNAGCPKVGLPKSNGAIPNDRKVRCNCAIWSSKIFSASATARSSLGTVSGIKLALSIVHDRLSFSISSVSGIPTVGSKVWL